MEDSACSKDCLLGPLHRVFGGASNTDGGRLGVAAQSIGLAQGCLGIDQIRQGTSAVRPAYFKVSGN